MRASLIINMKVLCLLALGLAVVAAEISVDVTQELDRMARPEDRSKIFKIFHLIVKLLDKGEENCRFNLLSFMFQ